MASNFQRATYKKLLVDAVSKYLLHESNRTTMITVTRVTVSSDYANAIIFVTVLPEEREVGTLDFLKRKRPEVKEYIKKNTRISRIPFLDFEIDKGEKVRRTLDTLDSATSGALDDSFLA